MTDLSTTEITMFCLAGLYIVKEFAAPLVKGSFGRNLAAVDARAAKVDARLDGHDLKLGTHDKEISELNHEKISTSQLSNAISELKGVMTSNYQSLDTRIAQQGAKHDEKLKEALGLMTHEFNQKLASTLNVELERTVRQVVREELTPRGRRKP